MSGWRRALAGVLAVGFLLVSGGDPSAAEKGKKKKKNDRKAAQTQKGQAHGFPKLKPVDLSQYKAGKTVAVAGAKGLDGRPTKEEWGRKPSKAAVMKLQAIERQAIKDKAQKQFRKEGNLKS